MDPISISAVSGLRSRMESLDLLANNLANAGTAGYKKDSESFSLYMSEEAMNRNAHADPVTASLPVIERPWTDFSPGVIEATNNPLDVAIQGSGFLAVEGPDGTLYTRNGHLRVSGGELQTVDGYAVHSAGGGSIPVDSSGTVEISADGTIRQSGQVLGRLEIVDFKDPAVLRKVGRNYYQTDEAPVAAGNAEVLQGRLEGSNVASAELAVRLVGVMRQFELLNKAIVIGGEMNRKAIEEVARVGQ